MQKNIEKQARKSYIQQKDQSDCGVACLQSLVRYYGGDVSLEKLRELSGTSITGTSMLGLFQAAKELGFTAQGNEANIKALIEHAQPVILHVIIDDKLQHYVICYGFQDKKGFLISDPAKGVSYYSEHALNKIWKSKVCLTLEPNENFVKKETIKKSKVDWIKNLLIDDKKILLFSLLLGVGIVILNMSTAIFSQKLIDDILPSQKLSQLVGGIILLAFLLLIRVGFSALRGYLLTLQTKDFNNRIIQYFYGNLLTLPKPFFDTRKIGELTARLNDTNRIQRVIKIIINNFVIDLLMVLASFGFLFYYSWHIGVISLVAMPIYFYIIFHYNKAIIQSQKNVMRGYAMSESNFISSMQGIDVIKNNNRIPFFDQLNQKIYGHFQDKVFDLGKLNIRIGLYSGLVAVLFLIAIISVASSMVWYKNMKLGELVAILSITGLLIPSITNLAMITIPINEAKIAFDRMFEYTSLEKEKLGTLPIKEFNSLEMINVSFRFSGRKPLLQNINFTINKGEIVILSGENGSGKSTLSQIFQKFYPWESGNVKINETIPFQNIQLDEWRKLIGVLPQEIHLFQGNVLDNILLGEKPNEEKLNYFLERYNFTPFIQSLPQGLATIVGEEGVNLSGGQKQMLALMRVLYKNPQFLILDEPTSAMDEKNEQFVIDLLENSYKTIFIIAHKNENLEKIADKRYNLRKGNLVLVNEFFSG